MRKKIVSKIAQKIYVFLGKDVASYISPYGSHIVNKTCLYPLLLYAHKLTPSIWHKTPEFMFAHNCLYGPDFCKFLNITITPGDVYILDVYGLCCRQYAIYITSDQCQTRSPIWSLWMTVKFSG